MICKLSSSDVEGDDLDMGISLTNNYTLKVFNYSKFILDLKDISERFIENDTLNLKCIRTESGIFLVDYLFNPTLYPCKDIIHIIRTNLNPRLKINVIQEKQFDFNVSENFLNSEFINIWN